MFRYPNPQNRIHVTEKPLQLMRDVVQICEPGGRILDPFSGAGTTVLAAVQEGYEAVRSGGRRGYRVVELKGDEIYRNQCAMARYVGD